MLPIKTLNLHPYKESVKMGSTGSFEGDEMKRATLATLTFALATCGIVSAQDRSQTPSTAPAAKPLTVSGKLSADGRSLLTDIDTEWSIANAEVLRGREGSIVTIKCYVDPDRNQLRVLSVKSAPQLKYASRAGDPAFRR
jgi:hypothetical protein